MTGKVDNTDWTSAVIGFVITLGLIAWAFFWFMDKIEEQPSAPTQYETCLSDETNRAVAGAQAWKTTGNTTGNTYEVAAQAYLNNICENKKSS